LSSKLTGGVAGDGLDSAAFAMGATALGAGAGVSAVSVSADEVGAADVGAGALTDGTDVAGTDATSGFASDFPESEVSFGTCVVSGVVDGGAGEGVLPTGGAETTVGTASPLAGEVGACASGGTEFPVGSTGAPVFGGAVASGAELAAGMLCTIGFGTSAAQGYPSRCQCQANNAPLSTSRRRARYKRPWPRGGSSSSR
jgi:hypothetical protein